jgi:hypothetical protein
MYQVLLDIYSNVTTTETVELRVWDADKGVEYRNALPNVTFVSNTLIGTPRAPETIIAGSKVVQNVGLSAGWNWTSFNVNSADLADVNLLMGAIEAQSGDQIKAVDKFDIYTAGIGWSGTISSSGGLRVGDMYQIKTSVQGTLDVIGDQAAIETLISIVPGWNWIGFVPKFNINLDEAFASFNATTGDIIKSQYAFSIYDQDLGWIGSLQNLEPGEGYLFNSSASGDFRYPEASFLSGRTELLSNVISDFRSLDRHKYPHTMTIIASLEEVLAMDNLVAVYAGEELRGIMEPMPMQDVNARSLYFLTIYGAVDGEALSFKSLDADSERAIVLDQQVTFEANQALGSIDEPFQLTAAQNPQSSDNLIDQVHLYPNPFNKTLQIDLPNLIQTAPDITLTDLSGRDVGHFLIEKSAQGWSATLKGSQLDIPRGVYLVKVLVGEVQHVYRIIKED